MAVNAVRTITINLTGDVILDKIFEAAENAVSPGSVTIHSLISGNNTITVPSVTGYTVKGATIVPPSDNTQTLTLKGVNGDTGVAISPSDPTSLGFGTAPATFVLSAGAAVAGVRIVWN